MLCFDQKEQATVISTPGTCLPLLATTFAPLGATISAHMLRFRSKQQAHRKDMARYQMLPGTAGHHGLDLCIEVLPSSAAPSELLRRQICAIATSHLHGFHSKQKAHKKRHLDCVCDCLQKYNVMPDLIAPSIKDWIAANKRHRRNQT